MGVRGTYKFLATVEAPGAAVPDGDGGYVDTWAPLTPPTWWCSVAPASARNLERQVARTIEATATHELHGDYHPGITTTCRLWIPDPNAPTTTKRYDVTSVQPDDEGRRYLTVFAAEYITTADPRPKHTGAIA